MGKLGYLIQSAARTLDPSRSICPNCAAPISTVVERKYVVTALRRCSQCALMFRAPIDDPAEAERFYNSDYEQGFTTDVPSPEELDKLKRSNFSGGEKDYSYYIETLRALGLQPGAKLFDFGCSWGYGSYQFAKAGFDTLSYEISKPRGSYGAANLGVRLVPDFDEWAAASPASMDGFFSSHVLEHVPSPSKIIAAARRVLRPGGLFVSFFPNGSAPARAALPQWSRLWGAVHPNFLDDVYLNQAVSDRPRLFGSSTITITPGDAAALKGDDAKATYINDLTGNEMFVAFRV